MRNDISYVAITANLECLPVPSLSWTCPLASATVYYRAVALAAIVSYLLRVWSLGKAVEEVLRPGAVGPAAIPFGDPVPSAVIGQLASRAAGREARRLAPSWTRRPAMADCHSICLRSPEGPVEPAARHQGSGCADPMLPGKERC